MNDYSSLYSSLPVDTDSSSVLARQGLRLGVVPASDGDATRRWLLAEARGFHDETPTAAGLASHETDIATDLVTGVWDASLDDSATPVATVRSWQMYLTIPGGSSLPAWAISSVTVAPTHRRRGIARALVTAELRAAWRLRLPMAMLTVSEATIYGRYGFGPAARQSPYTIETARAGWIGPTPPGRVQFVSPETLLRDGPPVFERSRMTSPGEVDRRDSWWKHTLGMGPTEGDERKRDLRAVRYDDGTGAPQGFALYEVTLNRGAYPGTLALIDLVAATDDAYAALWRFVIELDLVSAISAPLRSVSEPVAWQVVDHRAVHKTDERDHLWLRILDVPRTLDSRAFSAPGEFVLGVSDDLGFADGDYLLTVEPDGRGTTHLLEGPAPRTAVQVSLAVADLATLYLGGVGAVDLARAGRITEQTPDAAVHLDAAFHWAHTPRLSTWF